MPLMKQLPVNELCTPLNVTGIPDLVLSPPLGGNSRKRTSVAISSADEDSSEGGCEGLGLVG